MKEEATFLSIGSSEENGSMYPLLQNSFLEEITKNRAYILAEKLAEVKGDVKDVTVEKGVVTALQYHPTKGADCYYYNSDYHWEAKK